MFHFCNAEHKSYYCHSKGYVKPYVKSNTYITRHLTQAITNETKKSLQNVFTKAFRKCKSTFLQSKCQRISPEDKC